MQKDSNFPCFAALGEQTATQLRERFQPTLTHSLVGDHVDRLIDTSLGSNWTRLYDSVSTACCITSCIMSSQFCLVPVLLTGSLVIASLKWLTCFGDSLQVQSYWRWPRAPSRSSSIHKALAYKMPKKSLVLSQLHMHNRTVLNRR